VGMKASIGAAVLATAALGVIAACGNPFVTGDFGVNGDWAGSARAGSGADTVRFFFDLSLTQDRGALSGSGEVRGGTATIPVELTGSWQATGSQVNVGITMHNEEIAPLTFVGVFDVDTIPRPAPDSAKDIVADPDTLVGTVTGSGFTSLPLRLGRSAGS
jgi:hypothetical protein